MLNPVTGLRDAQRRAGVTPVNHARDNLLAIKALSLKNKARKEAEAATRAAPFARSRRRAERAGGGRPREARSSRKVLRRAKTLLRARPGEKTILAVGI